MKNVFTKDVTGIVLLLVVFVVAGILLAGNDTGGRRVVGVESTPDPSVYNDRGSGSRALYDLVNKLGFKSDIERMSWTSLPSDCSLLFAIAPDTKVAATWGGASGTTGVLCGDDWQSVRRWLEPGRTLVLTSNEIPAPVLMGGAKSATKLPGGEFGDAAGFTIGNSLHASEGVTHLSPSQPLSLFEGVSTVAIHGSYRVRRPQGDGVVLFGRPPSHSRKGPLEGEPAALEFRVGKGRVIAIADGYFACNHNLSRADNAAFITNIILSSTHPGAHVLFDEYHHGISTRAAASGQRLAARCRAR